MFEYGIKEDIELNQYFNNPVGMLLLTVHLFKTMPHYFSKENIEFECCLHEKVVKEIIFNNPSSKSINYSVRLVGHKNFSNESDILKIDPK